MLSKIRRQWVLAGEILRRLDPDLHERICKLGEEGDAPLVDGSDLVGRGVALSESADAN